MPRVSDNKIRKKNATEERLRATPFDSVGELDAEEKLIRLSVWRRFTEAQVVDELLTKPEGEALKQEWKAGLICFYTNESKDTIYKIFSEGRGLKLQLNKDFTKTLGEHEIRFLEGVVKAGIEGYGALYMRTKSLLQELRPDEMPLKAHSVKFKQKK